MYMFGNVKIGGYFISGGRRYRKVPLSKCWDHDIDEIRRFNAVGVKRTSAPMRHFEDDATLDDIPYRPDRVEPIPLPVIFEEVRNDIAIHAEGGYQEIATSLQEVLDLAVLDKWQDAYQKARSLDTMIRDYIPREMYDELCERGSG